MIRVLLLAHRMPLFRIGLRATLVREQDICIVGEAVEPESLLALVSTTSPDVVLLDGDQAAWGAVELVAQLRQQGVRGIMVLTEHPDEEALFRLLVSGAAAYEPATLPGADLVERVRRVAAGEYLISSAALLPTPVQPTRPAPASPTRPAPRRPLVCAQAPKMTRREREILQQLLRCRSNQEIATALRVTDQTVKIHLTAIFRKLGVPGRTAAIVMALRYGIISFDDVPPDDRGGRAQGALFPRRALIDAHA